MKKIYLSLLLLLPALFLNAQGPIKAWNDQLDDFIEVFNQIDPTLDQLYAQKGIDSFAFTYFDPETGNVIKEATIFDSNAFNNVNDDLMAQAKGIAVKHLSAAAKKNSRLNSILNEFAKRGTNIVLVYSADFGGNNATKKVVITPNDLK